MKLPYLTLLVGLAGGLLTSCAPEPPPIGVNRVPMSKSSSASSRMESQLLDSVNRYRARYGAQSLMRHQGLDELARQHANYLLQHRGTFKIYGTNVSHDGFEARSLRAKHQYQFETVGENVVAYPKGSADELVQAWSHSKGHDFTMKSDSWDQTGIGVAVGGDGMVFAVQLFAATSNLKNSLSERMHGF